MADPGSLRIVLQVCERTDNDSTLISVPTAEGTL
jgi:hypothetical protein